MYNTTDAGMLVVWSTNMCPPIDLILTGEVFVMKCDGSINAVGYHNSKVFWGSEKFYSYRQV